MAEITRADLDAQVKAPLEGSPEAEKKIEVKDDAKPEVKKEETKTPEKSEEFTYPNDDSVPEMLRGKKASEAASIFSTIHNTSRAMADQLQRANNQPAVTGDAKEKKPFFDKDEFVISEPDQIEKKLNDFFEAKAGPYLNDVYRIQTLNTLRLIEKHEEFPHFGKYRQEILTEAAPHPISRTADPNFWKDIHDRVAARHINEIASDITKRRPDAPITERGGGRTNEKEADELTIEDREIADGLGVDHKTFKAYKSLYAKGEA